jgi:hypothetical protein
MAKYDPQKQYKWETETEFKMNGNEFGLILNTFRTILNSPEARQVLLIKEANEVAEKVLAKNVEEGIVNEIPVPSQEKEKSPMEVVKE